MERYPQPQKQPEITSETVAAYPAKQNGLPYDIVIERMHTAPQKERPEQSTTQNFRITDNHLGEGGAKTKVSAAISRLFARSSKSRPKGEQRRQMSKRCCLDMWAGVVWRMPLTRASPRGQTNTGSSPQS